MVASALGGYLFCDRGTSAASVCRGLAGRARVLPGILLRLFSLVRVAVGSFFPVVQRNDDAVAVVWYWLWRSAVERGVGELGRQGDVVGAVICFEVRMVRADHFHAVGGGDTCFGVVRGDNGLAVEVGLGGRELLVRGFVDVVVCPVDVAEDTGHVRVQFGRPAEPGCTAADVRSPFAVHFVPGIEAR